MVDMYTNTPRLIKKQLAAVIKSSEAANINLTLAAAAEYMLDEGFGDLLENNTLLPIGDNRVLIEFGFYASPFNLDELVFQIQAAGLQPIIAHPERYRYYFRDITDLRNLHKRGSSLQINLLSLGGYYGKRVAALARQLLENNLVDYLGTDAHSIDHLQKIEALLNDRKVCKLIQSHQFKNHELLSA